MNFSLMFMFILYDISYLRRLIQDDYPSLFISVIEYR